MTVSSGASHAEGPGDEVGCTSSAGAAQVGDIAPKADWVDMDFAVSTRKHETRYFPSNGGKIVKPSYIDKFMVKLSSTFHNRCSNLPRDVVCTVYYTV